MGAYTRVGDFLVMLTRLAQRHRRGESLARAGVADAWNGKPATVDIAADRCSHQTLATPTCFDHSLQSFRNDRLPPNACSRSKSAENAG